MNFTAETAVLQKALGLVGRAASSKSPLHILGGLLLETHQQTLKIMATNLELAIKYTIAVEVDTPGSVVLPAAVFTDLLRKNPDQYVKVEVDTTKHIAYISGGSFEVELKGNSSEEFPELPSPDTQVNLNISSDSLTSLLTRTLYAVAADDLRPVFTGVLFELTDDLLTLYATDGFRIASAKCTCQYRGEKKRFIVPGKNLSELLRLLSALGGDQVEIGCSNNQLIVKMAGLTLISKLIEGNYPDLTGFIPSDYHTELTINTGELLGSLERAQLLVRDNRTGVVHIRGASDSITVLGKSELGSHEERIAAAGQCEGLSVSFTLRYLLDLVRSIESDFCTLKFAESFNLLVAEPHYQQGSPQVVYYGLLMPVTTEA